MKTLILAAVALSLIALAAMPASANRPDPRNDAVSIPSPSPH